MPDAETAILVYSKQLFFDLYNHFSFEISKEYQQWSFLHRLQFSLCCFSFRISWKLQECSDHRYAAQKDLKPPVAWTELVREWYTEENGERLLRRECPYLLRESCDWLPAPGKIRTRDLNVTNKTRFDCRPVRIRTFSLILSVSCLPTPVWAVKSIGPFFPGKCIGRWRSTFCRFIRHAAVQTQWMLQY